MWGLSFTPQSADVNILVQAETTKSFAISLTDTSWTN